MRSKPTNAGFSLVELLIVIAIVAILVAIGIPQYQSYRSKAYNSNAVADIRNLKAGLEAYESEFNEYPTSLAYQ